MTDASNPAFGHRKSSLPVVDGYSLDLDRGSLLRAGEPIHLRPLAYELLRYLVANRGKLISNEKLVEDVWDGRAVTDDALVQCLLEVRRALGPKGRTYVRNVRGRGYIFDAGVVELEAVGQVSVTTEETDVMRMVIEEERETDAFDSPEAIAISAKPRVRDVSGARRQTWVRIAILLATAAAVALLSVMWPRRPVSVTEPIRFIAVLPFSNVGGDPELEYLSDGITESVINGLSQIRTLRVLSRNSVFRYKDSNIDALPSLRKLGAQAVLMGRIVPHGSAFSISVELVDTSDNAQLWGEHYEKPASDLISLQNDIARKVSERLRSRVSSDEERRLGKQYTVNAEAYRLYLKGHYQQTKVSQEGFTSAVQYFKQAIEVDPTFAPAYAGLAATYRAMPFAGFAPSQQAFPMAKAAAKRALEIDPDLAEAHVVLGWVGFCYDWKWKEAEDELKRAIELNPNASDAYFALAHLYSNAGRGADALRTVKAARELDPLNVMMSAIEGEFLFYARRYEDAEVQAKKTLATDANFWPAILGVARVNIQRGKFAEAITDLKHAVKLSPGATEPIAQLGYAQAKTGLRSDAFATLELLMKMAAKKPVPAYDIAMIYNGLGDKEQALRYLRQSVEGHEVHVTFSKVDDRWDWLRKDPTYEQILSPVF